MAKTEKFEGTGVFIQRDPVTGDVVQSRKSESWEDFFALADAAGVPDDFLSEREDSAPPERD